MSSPLRRAVEQRSAVFLVRLRALPQWLPFLAVLALLLGGLFAPAAVGAALLAVLLGLLGWLTYLSWPALPSNGRLLRIAVLALIAVTTVQRALETAG